MNRTLELLGPGLTDRDQEATVRARFGVGVCGRSLFPPFFSPNFSPTFFEALEFFPPLFTHFFCGSGNAKTLHFPREKKSKKSAKKRAKKLQKTEQTKSKKSEKKQCKTKIMPNLPPKKVQNKKRAQFASNFKLGDLLCSLGLSGLSCWGLSKGPQGPRL